MKTQTNVILENYAKYILIVYLLCSLGGRLSVGVMLNHILAGVGARNPSVMVLIPYLHGVLRPERKHAQE